MRKHKYTEAEAPTNTGSITRPARLNLRLTCSDRARTHKVLCELRDLLKLPKDYCYADVWSHAGLLALERLVWHIKESPTAMKGVALSMFRPLPTEDHVRNRYAALKKRFETKARDAEQMTLAL